MTEPPPSARLSAAYAVSPSQLKAFDECERSWYLASVARAPDDDQAGGLYLLQGDLFDEAVGRYCARMGVEVEDLVDAVRAKPGLRGAALTTPAEKWVELAERAQKMLRAVQPHLPAPKAPGLRLQHSYRVRVPGYEDRGGVVLTGKADLRFPGYVADAKSTTDRGPGVGRDADTAPFALTDADTPGAGDLRPLRRDPQALAYAWCEFQLDPELSEVRLRWVYASKPSSGNPRGWAVNATVTRDEVEARFAEYVRPRLDRMVELHEASLVALDQGLARANLDSCARCFRRRACDPFVGAQQHTKEQYPVPTAAEIRARQAARAAGGAPPVPPAPPAPADFTLEAALRASITIDPKPLSPAITGVGLAPQGLDGSNVVRGFGDAVNRSASAVPATPSVITTTGVDVTESPAVALREALAAEAAAEPAAPAEPPPAVVADPADFPGQAGSDRAEPRRGRGRPRKPRPAAEAPETAPAGAEPVSAAAAPGVFVDRLERIATALQAVADAADSAVAVVNAELRALGVRL